MKLFLLGLVLCVMVVRGQEDLAYDDLPTRAPNVLRIVSTIIPPYLEVRPKPSSEPEAGEEETENDTKNLLDSMDGPDFYDDDVTQSPGATPKDGRLRRDVDSTGEPAGPAGETTSQPAVQPAAAVTTGEPAVKPEDEPAVEPTVKATAEPAAEPTVKTGAPAAEPTVKPTEKSAEEPVTTAAQPVISTAGPAATQGQPKDMTTEAAATTQTVTTEATTMVTTTEAEPMTPYQGFIPDLLDVMLPHIPNITAYEIYTVQGDETTSAYTKMLQEVIAGRADVAAGPMTVTMNKEKYVDFTYPFQRVEATIVMHRTLGDRFKTLEDLVNQDEKDDDHKLVNYGARRDGAIHKVLLASDDPLHKKMLEHMENDIIALKTTNAKGVNRARWGGYAFIIEGSLADWVVGQPPCSLIGVKAGFFKRQYAFAVQQRSSLRDTLNNALIEADGEMDRLREKWLTPGECSKANWLIPQTVLSSTLMAFITLLVSHFL